MAINSGSDADSAAAANQTLPLTITWSGGLADAGEIPAAELGAALRGYDRFVELSAYAFFAARLRLPSGNTSIRTDLRVRQIRPGSIIVDAAVFVSGLALGGVIQGAAYDAFKALLSWMRASIVTVISEKQRSPSLDALVDGLEQRAQSHGVLVSKDREETEEFATALDSALGDATVPLDSSAALQVLSVKGHDVEIVVDRAGRQAIKMPFAAPTYDATAADDVIEAPVRFIRLNKHTGVGLMQFVKPEDASQVAQQRFRCEDKAIRRRANQYTWAFHIDRPLLVRMQRKNYAPDRAGHYWLILGPAGDASDAVLPFTNGHGAPRKR